MNYIIFPDKDSTIYSDNDINTGLDRILEIKKETEDLSIARSLIHFNLSSISDIINQNNLTGSNFPKFYLNLYTATANQKNLENTFYAYAISGSWKMGTGTSDGSAIDGVTWNFRDDINAWKVTGGDYYNNVVCSASYGYNNTDLKMDVTNIVREWITGSINNDGFLLKRSDSEEKDSVDYGITSFYSMDTNTIYVPFLEMVSDDYIYAPSGSTFIESSKALISMPNLRKKYYVGSHIRFDVVVSQAHKRKTFYEKLDFNTVSYITGSDDFYYQIQDAYNGRILVPFSKYSKVSCDSKGHYFNLYTSGYMPERFYKITFKIISDNSELYFDNNYVFKVVK
jgi:hypothetical protein